jgi:abhydrolase domain-containing protein 17
MKGDILSGFAPYVPLQAGRWPVSREKRFTVLVWLQRLGVCGYPGRASLPATPARRPAPIIGILPQREPMPSFEWTPILLRGVRVVAIVYVVAAVGLWLLGNWLMFRPAPPSYRTLPGLVRIPVDGDTLAAVWLPNPTARYTVLYSHGNAEDLGDDLPVLRALRDRGFAVLAYDYRGYGLSTGTPSERKAYADQSAAYAWLTHGLHVPPDRILVHGRSLGGGPAAELASREPVAGLVLESTFTAVQSVSGWGRIFPFDWFRTARRLPRVRCPVLIIHGTADEVIPFPVGQRLYRLAPGPKQALWVEGAGHDDLVEVAGERYWQTLRRFADSLHAGEPARTPR